MDLPHCPSFPIYQSKPILNRCVPVSIGNGTKIKVQNLLETLTSWDAIEQTLADLHTTWKVILTFSLSAFGKYLQFKIIISLNYKEKFIFLNFMLTKFNINTNLYQF